MVSCLEDSRWGCGGEEMKKYEYKILDIRIAKDIAEHERNINKNSKYGWRIVFITQGHIILERELSE